MVTGSLILLLIVALVPAFVGEAHFNARTYALDFGRTPERRELDYVRQTAASVDTATASSGPPDRLNSAPRKRKVHPSELQNGSP